MVSAPELLRQHYLETLKNEDPHVAAAVELRKRWLSVHSELDDGGTLFLEKPGVATVPINTVIILWRPLDWDNEFDWAFIKAILKDSRVPLSAEHWDWLVAYLDGDQIVFVPHALSLLDPYDLVLELPE